MENSKQWSSAAPGYIIFLVDQSRSMEEGFKGSMNKAAFTALVINRTISDLIFSNSAGPKIKNRVFISIIGYGESISVIRTDYLSAFADAPIKIEKFIKQVYDGVGGLVDIEETLAIFIEPEADGLTPMGDAFTYAKQLIEDWVNIKPENPAPVIINISDGEPFEGDGGDEPGKTIRAANQIMAISTSDGNPLIFNIHIGDGGKEYSFEENEAKLLDDQAKLLFKISSKVPDSYKGAAAVLGFTLKDQSRGFISNAGPEALIKFINFGSSGAVDKVAK